MTTEMPDEEDELEVLRRGTTDTHETDSKASNTMQPVRSTTTSRPIIKSGQTTGFT